MTTRVQLTGDGLPSLVTAIPGPRSRELAFRLAAVESPNVTNLAPPPIFWADARGANVRDVDGNIFVDLTAGFGVTHAGHSNSAVVDAIVRQTTRLAHALGDVYPADIKVQLLERLAELMPSPLGVTILANSGSEAVEAALKTALLRTGKSGILAFKGAYHGLTYGALAATHRSHFRTPFEQQLFSGVRFADYPVTPSSAASTLRDIDTLLDEAEAGPHPIGAIIVEPIQGRGGIVVPAPGFLAQLRSRSDGRTRLLICDEIYTGCGRTGRWLASETENVVPDVVVIGKALSGSLPISACIGTAEVMSAWPRSHGEAIHTSTFLGNPVACAAALAQLEQIENQGLLERAVRLGALIEEWARAIRVAVRGRGLIQGVVLPSAELALAVCHESLQQGILVLAEGPDSTVLALTPPAVITDNQLRFALNRISAILSRVSP